MKRLKYIKNIVASVAVSLFLSSCSENTMDKINDINNYPLDVMAKASITDLLVGSGFNSVGGDFSSYASVYMEHEVGVDNQFFYAETRNGEPTSSATMDNTWKSTYSNMKVAKLIIKKCSTDGVEDGSDITLAIAKVMLAYNTAILTDLFGDIPFSEASELNEAGLPVYRQPKVDKQEVVYKEIFKLLDEALILFDGKDQGIYGAVGAYDVLYGGDGKQWKKVVYALKARYTMRLLHTYTDKNEKLEDVLEYIGKSFTSAKDEFKLTIYDGGNQTNPLCALNYSRFAFGLGQSLVDKLVERTDPRFSQMFIPYRPYHMLYGVAYPAPTIVKTMEDLVVEGSADPTKDFNYIAVNGDPGQGSQEDYAVLVSDYASNAPTHFLSYHELLFLKAEAEARLGKTEAEMTLKDAIVAAFVNHSNTLNSALMTEAVEELPTDVEQPETVAKKYFEDHVKALFTANKVKEIMNQKYLAFIGANGEAVEAYNDYRRLLALEEGDYIKLNNTKKFPLRFVYGASDATSNPNLKPLVGDGTYVYTQPVWWAGGTK